VSFRHSISNLIAGLMLFTAYRSEAAELSQFRTNWLARGDYDFEAECTLRCQKTVRKTGILALRPMTAGDQVAEGFRLYGWTDVDFQKLGAPIDASGVPSESRDPENPGVLVWYPSFKWTHRVSVPDGAPILLIGTLDNKKATRRYRDGAGIGLFVLTRKGRCVRGTWSEWGMVMAASGRFKLCRRDNIDEAAELTP
jgi:hypothetical protein